MTTDISVSAIRAHFGQITLPEGQLSFDLLARIAEKLGHPLPEG